MSAFSGSQSYRKEDMSVRLKSQNIKNARSQTKKLETETKKMEDRLRELKFAMTKEKEERESQGGIFWSRGQTGSLTTYAGDVLSKSAVKKNKENKQPENPTKSPRSQKRKVKVLRDQPIELPQRSAQPGTLSYIAQRSSEPSSKMKGPKCGQCEDRQAVWTCVQCSEDYCAGCFAAFHCKGALKKHRSVPLKNAGPRKFMSPRPTPPVSAREINCNLGDGAVASEDLKDAILYQSDDYRRNGPEGASGSFDGPTLGTGNYNEADSAASFQQALMAWRQGDAAVSGNTPTPRSDNLYSPVMTPVVSVDSSTGTVVKRKQIEIEFKTHSVSYAERLLLKKHRRTDMDSIGTPRSDYTTPRANDARSYTPRSFRRNSPRPLSSSQYRPSSRKQQHILQQSNDQEDAETLLASRVSFQALYNAMVPDHPEDITPRPVSSLSIIELNDPVNPSHSIEETSSFVVQEVDSVEAWMSDSQSRDTPRKSPENSSHRKPPSSSRKHRSKSGRMKPAVDTNSNNLSVDSKKTDKDSRPVLLSDRSSSDIIQSLETKRGAESVLDNSQHKQQNAKSRPLSSKSRPQSSKSRPQSARLQSARPKSSMQNRPSSRAQSRAASRLQGDGVLTKTADVSLKDIAARQRDEHLEHTEVGLGDFFMAGVQVLPEERTITPTPTRPKSSRPLSSRSTKKETVKVSNRLYHMAPKSWRPDSSLSEVIPVDQISVEDDKQGGAISGRFTPLYLPPTPRSVTPLLNNSQVSGMISNRPFSASKTRPGSSATSRSHSSMQKVPDSGRISKAIVMEGEDLSKYDEFGFVNGQGKEDEETLDKLEWELASESGRITADGKISRLGLSEDYSSSGRSSSASSGNLTQRNLRDQGFDINSKLKANELTEEKFSSPVSQDEDDVKALR